MALAATAPRAEEAGSDDVAHAAARIVDLMRALDDRDRQKQFFHWFPDETHEWRGQTFYARHLYPRHLEWFAASAEFNEPCFMAANRVGKTIAGAYAVTCHLTGLYPPWWPGRRFKGPTDFWAAGKNNETTRDIVQTALMGPVIPLPNGRRAVAGTGMVPGYLIGQTTWKQGVQNLIDSVRVQHVDGEWSSLGMKAYEQGRGSFEGTAKHGAWLDEEPPRDVYSECLTRTMTTDGVLMSTFTPLEGMSDVAMSFLPREMRPAGGEE